MTDQPSTPSRFGSLAQRIEPHESTIVFLMGLFRGFSAIGLGLLLFIAPDKSGSMLANKMGFFWLFSGIALLRLSRDNPARQTIGPKSTTILAVVGILAGLLMITRRLTERIAPEEVFVTVLGGIIIITGLLHLWSEYEIGGAASGGHRILHALMGVFELILGVMLVVSPLDQSRFTYWIVTIWALIFGVLAIGEAVAQWMADRKGTKAPTPETGT